MNLPPAGSSLHFFAMNEIRLFVSGYQRHFWISARHATEALFRALDKELHVELFLVGILREDTADRHTVCLEPEDCGFDPGAVQRYQRRDGAAVARLASDQSFELRPEAESALEKLVSPSERKGEPPVGLGVYFKLN